MKKQIISFTLVAAGFLLGATALSALASGGTWTAPTATPPNGNVAAPINTGSLWQSRAGALGIGASNTTCPDKDGSNNCITLDVTGSGLFSSLGIVGGNFVYNPAGGTVAAGQVLTSTGTGGAAVWGAGGGGGDVLTGTITAASVNHMDSSGSDTTCANAGGGLTATIPGTISYAIGRAGGANPGSAWGGNYFINFTYIKNNAVIYWSAETALNQSAGSKSTGTLNLSGGNSGDVILTTSGVVNEYVFHFQNHPDGSLDMKICPVNMDSGAAIFANTYTSH